MPRATVKIPTPLRPMAAGLAETTLEGATVGGVVLELTHLHPPLKRHLFTPGGELRNSVTVFVNDRDIRSLQRAGTPVAEGDVISIVPAIAGGSGPRAAAPSVLAPARAPPLDRDELVRYSRHLLLPEVGMAGQQKIRSAKVLIVGAGGLGSPAALYLAAAGIGEIGLVDFDVVDASNLQRQVLYRTADVGRSKLDAASDRLISLNPGVRVVVHPARLTSDNALEVLRPYDVVIDGTDNFPTRYLVNDACVLLGKPYVYGSIYRFEGQASVFDARKGPCYRCLYSEPPSPDLVPTCAEAGVLGVLPGLIGTVQATEALKLVLGLGESLVGRLLLYDAAEMRFRELQLRKNPACVLCSASPSQTGLIDYADFCGVPSSTAAATGATVPEIAPSALAAALSSDRPPLVIDVRDPEEWAIAHLAAARLIPRAELPEHLAELTGAPEVVLYCRTGKRSALATQLLLDLGFTNVKSLRGGINAWAETVDPSMPQY